jgi:hypothetical protein|tara:strand:+ start:2229 stop:2423 length:195 start_codon:yes stop_codon:yes gene_type:complete
MTSDRIYQVHLLHANGDEKIHAWFTYKDALKHVEEEKITARKRHNKISCYEIIEDVPTPVEYTS